MPRHELAACRACTPGDRRAPHRASRPAQRPRRLSSPRSNPAVRQSRPRPGGLRAPQRTTSPFATAPAQAAGASPSGVSRLPSGDERFTGSDVLASNACRLPSQLDPHVIVLFGPAETGGAPAVARALPGRLPAGLMPDEFRVTRVRTPRAQGRHRGGGPREALRGSRGGRLLERRRLGHVLGEDLVLVASSDDRRLRLADVVRRRAQGPRRRIADAAVHVGAAVGDGADGPA